MSEAMEIQPSGPVRGTLRPPGSKSITNRALVCAALAEGHSQLSGCLDSDDTRVMVDALRQLGIGLESRDRAETLLVTGGAGRLPVDHADLFVANSGTSLRFLTAMLGAVGGTYHLDGVPRMRQRPVQDLLDALNQLGGDVHSDRGSGCPPVTIRGQGLAGGQAQVAGSISSQFLSGLLLAAPYAARTVELHVAGPLVSQPYVGMTLAVMRHFGASPSASPEFDRFTIPPVKYRGCDYVVEPDASAASYFWGAAAVTQGCVTVTGLNRRALQGDVAFCECLEQMGCQVDWHADRITVHGRPLSGGSFDMNAISDTVQTLAVVALFADTPTTIHNVAHIRHKETDRIGDLARELRRLGADVEELADGLRITPGDLHGATVATYDDHRMAMSFALAGLRIPGVTLENPGCTAKTYPDFFQDLERLLHRSQSRE